MCKSNPYQTNKLMKQVFIAVFVCFGFSSLATFADENQPTPEQLEYLEQAKSLWNSLDRRNGEIKLPNGVATLNVPESFYYLSPEDAEKVLVQVWGNPPGAGSDTLGMLFPSESTPFDSGSWGVTIEYEEDGHVSDEEADEINYDELLSQMKEETRQASDQRLKNGYESIELMGWAATPYYDKESHKLHWAKELKFGDDADHTLNYNIRVLGRKGVLQLNFIAGMDQKALIDSKVDSVLAMADFDEGSKYGDFNPDIDKVAAYGIGALVAGTVLAKPGLLVAGLLFLKKFGIFILVGLGALVKGLFGRKKTA